jgi:hypothetical protein
LAPRVNGVRASPVHHEGNINLFGDTPTQAATAWLSQIRRL